jgi:hypothetical protein
VRAHAFTLVEMLFALGISGLVVTVSCTFLVMAAQSMSGTISQTALNTDAANVSDFIFSRVRLATSISNDASGNRLVLGFDDNRGTDADGDGKGYNDRNHYESFEFRTGTLGTTVSNNLVYRTNLSAGVERRLIRGSVRALNNGMVFNTTNVATVQVNFRLLDSYALDRYQSCEIRAVMVSRNRGVATTNIDILP